MYHYLEKNKGLPARPLLGAVQEQPGGGQPQDALLRGGGDRPGVAPVITQGGLGVASDTPAGRVEARGRRTRASGRLAAQSPKRCSLHAAFAAEDRCTRAKTRPVFVGAAVVHQAPSALGVRAAAFARFGPVSLVQFVDFATDVLVINELYASGDVLYSAVAMGFIGVSC